MTRRKGQSGTVEEVEALAKEHTTAVISELARLMRSSPSPAVCPAADALLERAWGKPRQQIDATVRQEALPPSELSDDDITAHLAEIRAEEGRVPEPPRLGTGLTVWRGADLNRAHLPLKRTSA